jgi:GR25 family glycosyltransferase involved in LPS biosynthesis
MLYQIPLIYYINLEKSKNRLNHMESSLNRYSLGYKRIDAIDGNNRSQLINYLHDPYIVNMIDHNKTILNGKSRTHRIKEIACILSHLKAIKTAYDHGLKHVIIAEDDINLDRLLNKEVEFFDVLNSLPKDWEIVQLTSTNQKVIKHLGQQYKKGVDFVPRQKYSDYKKWKKEGFWSNGAYLLNREGMRKIVEEEFKDNVVDLIDESNIYEADNYIYKHLKSYTLTGVFITLKIFSSTIGEKHMFEAMDSNFFGLF